MAKIKFTNPPVRFKTIKIASVDKSYKQIKDLVDKIKSHELNGSQLLSLYAESHGHFAAYTRDLEENFQEHKQLLNNLYIEGRSQAADLFTDYRTLENTYRQIKSEILQQKNLTDDSIIHGGELKHDIKFTEEQIQKIEDDYGNLPKNPDKFWSIQK